MNNNLIALAAIVIAFIVLYFITRKGETDTKKKAKGF